MPIRTEAVAKLALKLPFHISAIMSSEQEWDAESDISLTQASATPSVDVELPKKVDGKAYFKC